MWNIFTGQLQEWSQSAKRCNIFKINNITNITFCWNPIVTYSLSRIFLLLVILYSGTKMLFELIQEEIPIFTVIENTQRNSNFQPTALFNWTTINSQRGEGISAVKTFLCPFNEFNSNELNSYWIEIAFFHFLFTTKFHGQLLLMNTFSQTLVNG